MGSSETNLKVVDDAFGEGSDLYTDVLGVQSNASAEQIQAAFLQRRRDLFARLERNDASAERQMDAVVLAARILGDDRARLEYDDVRLVRLLQSQLKAEPESSYTSQPPVDTSYTSYSTTEETTQDGSGVTKSKRKKKKKATVPESRHDSPPRTDLNVSMDSMDSNAAERLPKRKARVVTPEHPEREAPARGNHRVVMNMSLNETMETSAWEEGTTMNETIDTFTDETTLNDQSVFSEGSVTTNITKKEHESAFDRCYEEMMGAFEDTSNSLEEVFNVFTLQEADITAVMKRIDKAKHEMESTL
jgi:curved DNA-binding protein CbpA